MRISVLLLLASLAAFAFGDPASDFLERVNAAQSREEFQAALETAPPDIAQDPSVALETYASRSTWKGAQRELRTVLETRQIIADPSTASPDSSADAQAKAKEILSSPVYADAGPAASRNWVSDALAEVGQFIADLFSRQEAPRMPDARAVAPAAVALKWIMWVLLGAALVGGVVWAIMRFQWGRKKLSRGGGLLDEDEPDRTADEWLSRAESMAAKGDYRHAVRCLYLACLMRFDEHGIARFDRSETNWEHLRRVQASAKAPIGFDFQPPTLLFDNVWYGHRWSGDSEYLQLHDVYTRLLSSLSSGRAA